MKLKGGVKLSTFAPERVAERQRETERDTDGHGQREELTMTFEEKMAKR
jgi:hypothetical protein